MLLRADDLFEDVGVVGGEIREDFAIQFDMGELQLIDEPRITDPVFFGGRADANLPEPSEIPLFLFSIREFKRPGVQERFLGLAEFRFARPQEPLGVFEDILTALIGDGASFDAGHRLYVGALGECADLVDHIVRRGHVAPFTAGNVAAFFCVEMVLMRVAFQNLAAAGYFDSLGECLFCLIAVGHFWRILFIAILKWS